MVNRFDGPIPGQSLTTIPGNAKWEKPPQFVDKDKAMDYLMKQIINADMMARLVGMMEKGASVDQLVKTLLFAGFTEGKWTHDLGVLLARPLGALIAVVYYNVTGKKPVASATQGQPDQGLVDIEQMQDMKPVYVPTQEKKIIAKQVQKMGILGSK